MIVISGALVVVALVLLVLGVTKPDLNLVYGSIVLSLVSLVFLVLGIVQRRGETLPGAAAGTTSDDEAAPPGVDQDEEEEPTDADELGEPEEHLEPSRSGSAAVAAIPASRQAPTSAGRGAPTLTGTVLVVANRPRYHVEGCRYLAGKQVEETDVKEARADGFTACGVCKPDVALAQAAEHGGDGEDLDRSQLTDRDVDRDLGPAGAEDSGGADGGRPQELASSDQHDLDHDALDDDAIVHGPASDPAPAARGGSRSLGSGDGDVAAAAAGSTTSGRAPAATRAAPAVRPGAVRVPAAPRAAAEQVVVIPDRNRYHRAECRHVRGLAGAEQLSTAQATQQGYSACGVCKP